MEEEWPKSVGSTLLAPSDWPTTAPTRP
ncbi:unnamed protein product [Ectocarpus sp. CCAP 1310/34]|nr:unnamed protein product [Ectocarpus sp. CCAP 1310/34]